MFFRLRGYALALLVTGVLFAGCGGTFQTAGDVAGGRQALFSGNYPAALGYFQSAAQSDPNYMYGAELREGVLSCVGRAQYLNGQLPAARTTLQQALAQNKSNNLTRLYLGLTLARQGDRQAATTNIQSALKGMAEFLNYIINTFRDSFGSFWDQNGSLRKSIAANQAMLASPNVDWSALISNLETLAMNYEQVEDIANQDQRQFQEMNRP